jgi:UDP-glucose 4-epimerase
VDLAKGHLAALTHAVFGAAMTEDCEPFNLGSGVGVSVLEMLAAMGKSIGRDLSYQLCARRPGDVATTVCRPSKANALLHWRAEKTLEEACADGWKWQSNNPEGYMRTDSS